MCLFRDTADACSGSISLMSSLVTVALFPPHTSVNRFSISSSAYIIQPLRLKDAFWLFGVVYINVMLHPFEKEYWEMLSLQKFFIAYV